MEPEELAEVSEHAHGKAQRTIGLTMAVIAALLATVTLMGHRLHTEETVQQTKANLARILMQGRLGGSSPVFFARATSF